MTIAQSLPSAHAVSNGMGNVCAFRAPWDRWEHIVTQYVPYVKRHARNTLYTRGGELKRNLDQVQITCNEKGCAVSWSLCHCWGVVEQLYVSNELISSYNSFETVLKTLTRLSIFLINDMRKQQNKNIKGKQMFAPTGEFLIPKRFQTILKLSANTAFMRTL